MCDFNILRTDGQRHMCVLNTDILLHIFLHFINIQNLKPQPSIYDQVSGINMKDVKFSGINMKDELEKNKICLINKQKHSVSFMTEFFKPLHFLKRMSKLSTALSLMRCDSWDPCCPVVNWLLPQISWLDPSSHPFPLLWLLCRNEWFGGEPGGRDYGWRFGGERFWRTLEIGKEANASSLAPAGSIFFNCYQKLIVPLSLPGMLTEQCWVVSPVRWQKTPNSFIL